MTCAGKQAQRTDLLRMTALATAAKMLGGQAALADVLSIGERAARAKLNAERGITYSDLTLAAKYLRVHAARVIDHAAKLDALAETVA